MSILSNKSILTVFAMAVCMASFANAQGTRGQVRRLKAGKSGKSSKAAVVQSFVTAAINSVTNTNTAVVSNANSVSSFDEKCPAGVLSAIESCSPFRPFICKTCVVGQSNFDTPTLNGILKCGHINLGERICHGCSDHVLIDYYNCGTGENISEPPVVTVTTPAVTTPGLSTPSLVGGTTTIIGTTVATGTTNTTNVTATVSSATTPGPPPDASYCPPENVAAGDYIESGDICDTQNYEYLECYYPGKKCSCYAVQPQFSCVPL